MPTDNDFTKILGWPGYRVYRHEINEKDKTLKLWVRRKRGNRVLRCPSCDRRVEDIHEVYQREVRDLPCFEYQTAVVVELYRICCPDCGVKAEKVGPLPRKAPYSKRFEDAVGQACESAAARQVARRMGLTNIMRGLTSCPTRNWTGGLKLPSGLKRASVQPPNERPPGSIAISVHIAPNPFFAKGV